MGEWGILAAVVVTGVLCFLIGLWAGIWLEHLAKDRK
jgi:hypothetical protein